MTQPRGRDALRDRARRVFEAAVAAVDPGEVVRRSLAARGQTLVVGQARLPLRRGGRLLALAVGKAAVPMLAAAERILGARLSAGLAVTKRGHGEPLRRSRVLESGHPVPDEAGLSASREVERLLAGLSADDVVLVLVSGGGSALLPAPAEGITLAEKQAVTSLLLASGADIGEMNCVRKHLSRLKGGGLARCAAPARVATVVLSDVVGDPLDVIASGPTVPDPTTFAEALAVLERRAILGRVPAAVRQRLEAGVRGELAETPKAGDPIFAGAVHHLGGTNRVAVAAAARAARKLGFRPLVLTTSVTGEAREVAAVLAAMAREVRQSGQPARPPCCLLSGGEPTVTLRGQGKGGRNQELALAAAFGIEGLAEVVLLSGGTDGNDGPTDAAGALCDGTTLSRARALGLDPRRHLAENDAYPFFEALGDLVITGPTRTNVMDLHVVLVGAERQRAGTRRRKR
ncbi:MAG: glycerate kinase [Deltaproteobacteria bacterium]|nr:glycerate kinase [Deltaproteobacteria bacterium]